jgi:hypothetical protein
MQSEGGLREGQLFAQGNDPVQEAYFNVGIHCCLKPDKPLADAPNPVDKKKGCTLQSSNLSISPNGS